jgi:hypothetical protein
MIYEAYIVERYIRLGDDGWRMVDLMTYTVSTRVPVGLVVTFRYTSLESIVEIGCGEYELNGKTPRRADSSHAS